MVSPDIRRFHSPLIHRLVQLVLAVGYSVARETLHPHHFPHGITGILDEPVARVQLPNQFQNVLVYLVTEPCVITDGVEISRLGVLPSVSRNGCDRERRTIGACPDNVWSPKFGQNLLGGQCADIGIQVDILETFIPLDGVDFVSTSLESLTDTSSTGE
jgi:hypothetical protein